MNKCLKKNAIYRYLDGQFSGKQLKEIEAHLSECPKCRQIVRNLKDKIKFVSNKLDILQPENIYKKEFIYPEKYEKSHLLPGFIKNIPLLNRIRPVYFTFPIMGITLFIVLASFFLPEQKKPLHPDWEIDELFAENWASQIRIHSIEVEGKPAQTYIMKDENSRITIVWAEKKEQRED